MVSGGARTRSAPAPDPNALRREHDKGQWRTLPAERTGDPPAWPLTKASARELTLWRGEWRRPQAVAWEANGQELEVALFVRSLAAAERPEGSVAARTLVRQQMDALGLTVPGLRSNRWTIGGPPLAEPALARVVGPSAKERLRVVENG